MKVGDIVKVKRGMTIEVTGEQTYIGVEDRFIVIDTSKHNVVLDYLDYLGEGRAFLLGKCFIEIVSGEEGVTRWKSLGKVNLNPEPKLSKRDILMLIDLALDTGDKEWFNELHSKLNTLT